LKSSLFKIEIKMDNYTLPSCFIHGVAIYLPMYQNY